MWSALPGMLTSPHCAMISCWLLAASLWSGMPHCPAQERAADDGPRPPAAKPGDAKSAAEGKPPAEARPADANAAESPVAAAKSADFWAAFPDDIRYLAGPDGR